MRVLPPFDYIKVSSITDAVSYFTSHPNSIFYAGGNALIPTFKRTFKSPSLLIDLKGIAELYPITYEDGLLKIGSMSNYEAIIDHPLVQKHCPSLVSVCQQIADCHIRRRATIGGALVDNDFACDIAAACLGLNAILVTNQRQLSMDEWLQPGPKTALNPGEILTSIHFNCSNIIRASYEKKTKQSSHYPIVGVFIACMPDQLVRVAITATTRNTYRDKTIETLLSRSFDESSVDQWEVDKSMLIDDHHGKSDYRAHLLKILVKQCLRLVRDV